MTYNVFGGVLNLAQLPLHQVYKLGIFLEKKMNSLNFEVKNIKRSKVKVTIRPNMVKNHLFKNVRQRSYWQCHWSTFCH